jgi:hypothetical protein
MSTPPPQDPTQVYQQPGGQPPYQAPPPNQQGSGSGNPWPWVFGAVALIVAGVIAAILITGSDDSSKTPKTDDRTQTIQTTITQATTQTQTVTVPTTVTTPPDNGGQPAP